MKRNIILLALSLVMAAGLWAQEPIKLTLDECRQLALKHDERIKQMSNQERQAEIDRQVSIIGFLPKIDGSLMGFYLTPSTETMGMKMVMHGTYLAGLTLQQPIYTGGRLIAGKDLAKIGQEVAMENFRKTRQDVIADVDNAYWSLVAVIKKVEMLETYISYMDALLRDVSISVEAEMALESELLRIETKKNEIEYNMRKAQTGVELCKLMLCNYIGLEFGTDVFPADQDIPISEPRDLSEDISALPELSLLQLNIDAKKKQVNLTRGEYLPSIAAMASYCAYGNIKMQGTTEVDGAPYSYSNKLNDTNFLVGVAVSVPLVNWGEGFKKVKKAKLDVENARLDLEQNQRLLSIQARQAILNVTDGYVQIETAEKGVKQSDENLRVMTERYNASMATLTDLLDAQSQWQQSQSNLIEARTQYRIYMSEYLRATGRLE